MYHNRIDDVVAYSQDYSQSTWKPKWARPATTTIITNLCGNAWTKNTAMFPCSPNQTSAKCWIARQWSRPTRKKLVTFAQQLHDSVSKLTHGKEVSELSSQGNIRFMIMKLTPHLQLKWDAKCYDSLPRLTGKSKRQQCGKLLCGGVPNDINERFGQQRTQKGKGKSQPATSTINHVGTSSPSTTKTTTSAAEKTTKRGKPSFPVSLKLRFGTVCSIFKQISDWHIIVRLSRHIAPMSRDLSEARENTEIGRRQTLGVPTEAFSFLAKSVFV